MLLELLFSFEIFETYDKKKLTSKKNGTKQKKSSLSRYVTMEGFEPSRPYEHHPLKMASLPFLHMA